MIREIKFRGKRVNDGRWVYGSLLQSEIAGNGYAKCAICERFADSYAIREHDVIPESVGEWTGRNDKVGMPIFEGDIVKRMVMNYDYDDDENDEGMEKEEISIIEYRSHGFWVKDESFGWEGETLWSWGEMEVIGNIHESNTANAAT